MGIQENLEALGQWSIDLLPSIPREKLDAIQYFGHIAVVHGRVDPIQYGDSLLTAARYVGVVRDITLSDDARTNTPNDNISIGGAGMAFWLGDEDNKGAVIENATTFASGSTFPNVIRGLLPSGGAVTEGTLYSVPGSYAGTHQWQTSLFAIQYVCDTMGTPSAPVSWRVNGNGTLDAGPETNLYVTSPQCAVVARGAGEDMALRAVPGSMNLTEDVEDFTTRVVLLAQGDGASIATASADISSGSNPYKDIHGNTLKITRMVSESDTSAPNAPARAQLALSQFTVAKRDLKLNVSDYDVDGSFKVGDYVWAYDPDKGLFDPVNEIVFRGQRLNPIKLQVVGLSWPVTADYTVAYRGADGTWTDLTDYVSDSGADTTVTVGSLGRQSGGDLSLQPVGSRPDADHSIPGVPVLVTPFQGAAYLDSRGFTRSRVRLQWNAPLNVDGSTILDGDHYDIRYAVDTDMIYPATWSQVSQVRWQDMQLWAQPFAAPTGQWQTMVVGWDQATAQLQDLSPGVGYDVQIRAVDSSGNAGAWSPTTTFVATQDNIAPSTPAAPLVAASRIAVQVTHLLGVASGGDFNLESDLDHLEIHAQYEPAFTPDDSTLLGKLKANAGMIQAQIPAVGTYSVESTDAIYVKVVAVDMAGNRSAASVAVQSTALLIDDAHISDLTVSKVTAGTITASWVMAGEIKTADDGARARISSAGIELYNAAGVQTMLASAADGSLSMIGQLSSAASGRRIVINADTSTPDVRFYADSGTDYSFISAFSQASLTGIGMTSAAYSSGGDNLANRIVVWPSSAGISMQTVKSGVQTNKGGFVGVDPGGVAARYEDAGSSIIGGRMTLGSSNGQFGYDPGGSDEAMLFTYPSSVAVFGTMSNQLQANQMQVQRTMAASNGFSFANIAFDITYASRPYGSLGFSMSATGGQGRFTSITTTVASIVRDSTTGAATIDALFTRAV